MTASSLRNMATQNQQQRKVTPASAPPGSEYWSDSDPRKIAYVESNPDTNAWLADIESRYGADAGEEARRLGSSVPQYDISKGFAERAAANGAPAGVFMDITSPEDRLKQTEIYGLQELLRQYGQDPSKLVQSQIQREQTAVRQGADDARVRMQQNIAQRGMGTSSAGLSAMAGLDQQTGRQIRDIQLSAPERERAIRSQGISQLLNPGAGALHAPNVAPTQQDPGKAPVYGPLGTLVGTAVGAKYGNPAAGAYIGGAAGSLADYFR